jgi:hypothetical protein
LHVAADYYKIGLVACNVILRSPSLVKNDARIFLPEREKDPSLCSG